MYVVFLVLQAEDLNLNIFVDPCLQGRCCCAGAAVRYARPAVYTITALLPPACVHLVHFAFSAHLKAWQARRCPLNASA
jgi:hypothetical protein